MFKNVASQKVVLFAYDSTTGAPKTGDAANITPYVSIDGGAVTALTDTSATEMSSTNAKGDYQFDVTQAETNGDNIRFTGKSSTANVVVLPKEYCTAPAYFTTQSIDSNGRVDVIKIAGTTQTAADLAGTRAEPAQGAPAATASFLSKIDYLYKAWRNRSTQTATQYKLMADDETTVDHKATCSNDGTTFIRQEITSGP